MRYAIRGALATAMTLALGSTAIAQSAGAYYSYGQQPVYGHVGTTIAPAATSTYQTPATTQPTTGSTLYPSANTYAPQQVGTTYATSPSSVPSYTSTTPAYTTSTPTTAPAATDYSTNNTTPYAPQPTYTAPTYGSAPATAYQPPAVQQPSYTAPAPTYRTATTPTYQPPSYTGPTYAQPQPTQPYTPSAPASVAQGIQDTDAWSYNLARFYPAVQACLRKSVTKNPVVANIQERDNKTMMLIGEGGSTNYSTCETGLSGTVVKANSETRGLPPAFFAPLGSTFTVSPDRPFQPIVDTNQKVIGWLVRTQPANAAYGQFGQAPSFDGQFIPPMMVNTAVGKS